MNKPYINIILQTNKNKLLINNIMMPIYMDYKLLIKLI